MEQNRHFDLLKAFDYIERIVKFDFFSEKKRPCVHHACATWDEQPSSIETMVPTKFKILTNTIIIFCFCVKLYL